MRTVMNVLVLSISLAWASVAAAQVPRTMSYQGSLTDAAGAPVADGAYALSFRLYTAPSGGAAIFSEQQSVVVTRGSFSAVIGGVTVGGIPAAIPFTGQYYLGISINGAAELLPRTALTASPYALNAVTSTGLLLPAVQTGSAAAPLLSLSNAGPAGAIGIFGAHTATTGNGWGVLGETSSTGPFAAGVFGRAMATASGGDVTGVAGWNFGTSALGYGVYGYHAGSGIAVRGYTLAGTAVRGITATGKAGSFTVTDAASTSDAVEVTTSGTGRAGYFGITNASSTAAALEVITNGAVGKALSGTASGGVGSAAVVGTMSGLGRAGSFTVSNALNYVQAVSATTSGVGVAGAFDISNASSSASALVGQTIGIGVGVYGIHSATTGTNPGVRGETASTVAGAAGVEGVAPPGAGDGVRGVNNGGGSPGVGVHGVHNGGGSGVLGTSAFGSGVVGSTSSGGTGVYGENTGSGHGIVGFSAGGGIGVFGRNTAGGAGVYAQNSSTGSALVADHTGTSGNIAIFENAGAWVARIDRTGRGFFNGGTQTGGADLAEAFEVEGGREACEPGDVLAISMHTDRTLERSSEPNSTRVAGVYATKPGVLLTDLDIEADASRRVPLGVVGVIPTKVSAENGPIRRGDLLVTAATPGHAMKAGAPPAVGTVLGKALQDFAGPGTGIITVLVNVK